MTNERTSLAAEWERVDLLGVCLAAARRGEEADAPARERLKVLQTDVLDLRRQQLWASLISAYGLQSWDVEILVCALAPEAEPHLGWMFQQLQGGAGSPYPTIALLRELFFVNADEAEAFHERFASGAPLMRAGLIEPCKFDSYSPIRPSAAARAALLGWQPVAPPGFPGAAQIEVQGTMEDLVLPAGCIKALREFLLWMRFRDKVVGEWGARAVGGPVALFAGPSGTGKTFAAEVLAHELGWPLYRIDLGLVVSKYVGETEQNLNALFEAAQSQRVVLLFDEADSLFGKRGDIKEARDRYANMEVSHLLSRMERHHGPCILTTNLRQNLDAAFARRFHSVIEFPRPNAQARALLWRKHFPPRAPTDPAVDCEALGRAVELTGGQIRNAALHAAYLAAGEGGTIDLPRVARGVWQELAKEGSELMRSSLGWLADYLPREERHALY